MDRNQEKKRKDKESTYAETSTLRKEKSIHDLSYLRFIYKKPRLLIWKLGFQPQIKFNQFLNLRINRYPSTELIVYFENSINGRICIYLFSLF
jgi:hypothetical protein